MTAMYNSHFGFREAPFSATSDPRFFYTNPLYQEAYATLHYGITAKKGLVVITGEVGTGKTTLLRKLMRNLEATVHPVFIFNTLLNFAELLRLTLRDLGLARKEDNGLTMVEQLNAYLIGRLKEGHVVSLLIDESQNLTYEVLEGLRLLSNLETDKEKLLQIVLMGQPELEKKLDRPSLRQLKQRIAVHCQLAPLHRSEVGPYIDLRLRVAGYDGENLFDPDTIEQIALYSGGVPRLINIICDNTLLNAYGSTQKTVSIEMIHEVARDLQLKAPRDIVIDTNAPSPQLSPTFIEYAPNEVASDLALEPPRDAVISRNVPSPQVDPADTRQASKDVTDDFKLKSLRQIVIDTDVPAIQMSPTATAQAPLRAVQPRGLRSESCRRARVWIGRLIALVLVVLGTVFFQSRVPNLKNFLGTFFNHPKSFVGLETSSSRSRGAIDAPKTNENDLPATETPRQVPISFEKSQPLNQESLRSGTEQSQLEHRQIQRKGRETSLGTFEVVRSSLLRDTPRSDAEIIATLQPPMRVKVVSAVGSYLRVQSLDDAAIRGYVHREDAFFAQSENSNSPSISKQGYHRDRKTEALRTTRRERDPITFLPSPTLYRVARDTTLVTKEDGTRHAILKGTKVQVVGFTRENEAFVVSRRGNPDGFVPKANLEEVSLR
jgi:general secretion pathway protein A